MTLGDSFLWMSTEEKRKAYRALIKRARKGTWPPNRLENLIREYGMSKDDQWSSYIEWYNSIYRNTPGFVPYSQSTSSSTIINGGEGGGLSREEMNEIVDKAVKRAAVDQISFTASPPLKVRVEDGGYNVSVNTEKFVENPIDEDIDMNKHSILNLKDPVEEGGATSKKYVDTKVKTVFDQLTNAEISRATDLDVVQEKLKDNREFTITTQKPMTGDLDMANHSIINVKTPVTENDAVNKKYVDDVTHNAKEVDDNTKENRELIDQNQKDIMTNRINYLNTSAVMKGEKPMPGRIDMGNQFISNVKSPDKKSDAATKEYVDSRVVGKDGIGVVTQEYLDVTYLKKNVANDIDLNNHSLLNVRKPEQDGEVANKLYVDEVTHIGEKGLDMKGKQIYGLDTTTKLVVCR